jgi:hypothetical protein
MPRQRHEIDSQVAYTVQGADEQMVSEFQYFLFDAYSSPTPVDVRFQ